MSFSKYKTNEILTMYNGRCAYCGYVEPLTVDHMLPKSRKGTGFRVNLVPACISCNETKNDMTVEEFRKAISIHRQIQIITLELYNNRYYYKLSDMWYRTLSRFANHENIVFWLDNH